MAPNNYGKLIINVIRFLINYMVRFVFAGIVLYCSWVPLQELDDWFSYHVIMCSMGYMPLIAEALMLFAGDELCSRQLSRRQKSMVHGILITVGTVFTVLGNLPGIYYIKPGYHLYTVHGITGLVSMIILTLSIFLGLAANYPDKMKEFLSMKPICYKSIHNLVGLLGYTVGIISLCLAYFTDWFVANNGEVSRLTVLIFTILAALWSTSAALVSGYGQIKKIFF